MKHKHRTRSTSPLAELPPAAGEDYREAAADDPVALAEAALAALDTIEQAVAGMTLGGRRAAAAEAPAVTESQRDRAVEEAEAAVARSLGGSSDAPT